MNAYSAKQQWISSSYSGNGGGNCVEWAPAGVAATGVVPVRDSKDTALPPLTISAGAWSAFVEHVKE